MNSIYPAFSVYGIEIEFMIVDKTTYDIKPIADILIEKMSGELTNEFERGNIAVSNELALHVIELKTNGPKSSIREVNNDFIAVIHEINETLAPLNAVLLPTGMHPWYTPDDNVKLWPHGDKTIYQAYHRIFNCRGHGWSNLQSTHLNLPFANEAEFVKLHSAIRLLLPLIPALTASTPFVEGNRSKTLDSRLSFYGGNQKSIPSISGMVIPEFITSLEHYHQQILQPMYRDIAPHDPSNTLQYEWLNSRGAIARFDRNAIEIRVVDTQECIEADLACASVISAALQHLTQSIENYFDQPIHESILRQQFDRCIQDGMDTAIVDQRLLTQLGCPATEVQNAGQAWELLYQSVQHRIDPAYQRVIEYILREGNLAHRLAAKAGDHPNRLVLTELCKSLAQCLNDNRQL